MQKGILLLLRDLCSRLPYGVNISTPYGKGLLTKIWTNGIYSKIHVNIDPSFVRIFNIEEVKPYLFPLSSMTEEDHAIYSKIWEDAGKMSYSEGHHHLISTIKAYKAANDYLLSKHYDINGLIPMGLAIDATNLSIY